MQGKSADSNAVVREYYDRASRQIVDYLREVQHESVSLMTRGAVSLPEENQARHCSCLVGENFAKVSVRRNKNPVLVSRGV